MGGKDGSSGVRAPVYSRTIVATPTPTSRPRFATARSWGHHGEILQGSFRQGASTRRALVTMPCQAFWSQVSVEFTEACHRKLHVRPADKTKVRRAVSLTLDAIGVPGYVGSVIVSSNIAPCRGYGSSTADVTAAIRAVLKAFDRVLPVERIARLSVSAEGASDGTLWERPVLFAQREGQLVEDFGKALPSMRVLAFESATCGTGVDTLALPPARYDNVELDEFSRLRSRLRAGVQRGDVRMIGAVATASAAINQRHLTVPAFAELMQLARACGAAGLQVAHSGDVAGLLFEMDPGRDRAMQSAQEELAARGLRPWRFVVGGDAWLL
jgi:uncharacterized protein involved in propanediol utilization